MKSKSLLALAIFQLPVFAHSSSNAPQSHLSYDSLRFDSESDASNGHRGEHHYKLPHPVRKAAVIGAGLGGLVAYRELVQSGISVHVYERDRVPGGNWHYTEDEVPVVAPIPNQDSSIGDYEPTLPPEGVELPYVEEYEDEKEGKELKRAHRAPKPIWGTLTADAAAVIQQIRQFPWPIGTPWELPHWRVQRYLRSFASWQGLNGNDQNPVVFYNTRVEKVKKRLDKDGKKVGWTLTLKEVVETGDGNVKATWWKEDYDAVLVATGRFNSPNIPNIPGLKEWNDKYPGRISHSRRYRVPEEFKNQTVLVVGASASGSEIARDIVTDAKAVYVSIRDSKPPIPTIPIAIFAGRLPLNVTVLPAIKRVNYGGSEFSDGKVELINGTVLSGFDRVIFATGYRYSYPFLPQYHNSSLGLDDHADPDSIQPIVTDGTHLRSLYLDAFYIPDPTLVFLNMNYGLQTFVYSEYVALAAAKVWSGKAGLPNEKRLWDWYREEYKRRKGYGKHYLFLGAKASENIRFFQGWLNADAVKYGGRQIDGLPKGYSEITSIWFQARFAGLRPIDSGNASTLQVPLGPELPLFTVDTGNAEDKTAEYEMEDFLLNDYW